jgi:hypothetical protein
VCSFYADTAAAQGLACRRRLETKTKKNKNKRKTTQNKSAKKGVQLVQFS